MECRPEVQFSSVAQSCPTLCNPMDCSMPGFPVHHQLPTACSNSCPSSWWCHATLSSSVIPFSSCLQSLPASNQKWLKYNCWRGKLWLCCTMNAYQRFSSSDNLYSVIQFDVKRFKFFFNRLHSQDCDKNHLICSAWTRKHLHCCQISLYPYGVAFLLLLFCCPVPCPLCNRLTYSQSVRRTYPIESDLLSPPLPDSGRQHLYFTAETVST